MGNSFLHESSFVDWGVAIGNNCKIWHFCHIMSGAVIGDDTSLGQNCFIAPRVKIGSRVKIQNNVSVYEGVEIEDDVFLGPSMVFTNIVNPRAFISRKEEFKVTHVKQGVTIGANATIVCGNTIGEYAMIGAGAVVTHDVPAYALMLGVPARQMGWVGKSGEKLAFKENKAQDEVNGELWHYVLKDDMLRAYQEKEDLRYGY